MATDATLLALVVDDERAARVLAAWVAIEITLDSLDVDRCRQIANLARVNMTDVRDAMDRLQAARLAIDGGTSELGERWLQSYAAKHLDVKRQKSTK